jgi:hypothetical protein
MAVVCVGGRENDGDGEGAEEEKENDASCGRLYSGGRATRWRHVGRTGHAKQQLATAARLEAIRRPPATTGGGALPLETDFELITRMPLTKICKLLSKIL